MSPTSFRPMTPYPAVLEAKGKEKKLPVVCTVIAMSTCGDWYIVAIQDSFPKKVKAEDLSIVSMFSQKGSIETVQGLEMVR